MFPLQLDLQRDSEIAKARAHTHACMQAQWDHLCYSEILTITPMIICGAQPFLHTHLVKSRGYKLLF